MADTYCYNCPKCGASLKVAPAWFGKQALCKKCKARFRIPHPGEQKTVMAGSTALPVVRPVSTAGARRAPTGAESGGSPALERPGKPPARRPAPDSTHDGLPRALPEPADPADEVAIRDLHPSAPDAAGVAGDLRPTRMTAGERGAARLPTRISPAPGLSGDDDSGPPAADAGRESGLDDGDPIRSITPDQLLPEVEPDPSTRHRTKSAMWSKAVSKVAAERPAPTGPQPYPKIAGYEILGELGRGGMGVVYRARHLALDRPTAIKMVLSGAHAGAEELRRFRSEAEAVARLTHPNIVQIYEVGEDGGRPFFSLEFVDGGSLSRRLTGGAVAPRQAAELIASLAAAVHYAHQRGIVHRDLKPANILLTADGTPKITDFGLAKRLEGEDRDAVQTKTGAVMGTPSYMAPEQAEGKNKDIGPPADIYALGAILYDLITGRPPFQGASQLDTLFQVLSTEPVPPRKLQKRIPVDLETICLKCLQKDPQRRYPSADALAEDLRRFLSGEPIRARPVGTMERVIKWVKRRPAVAALVAVSLAAAVTGAMFYNAELRRRAADARRDAEDARRARELAELAHKTAVERETASRRTLYAAHMNLAGQAWDAAHVGRMRELLELHRPADGAPDLRGFEWHYLARLARGELFTLPAGQGKTTCVAFSPDGRLLATAGSDGSIKLWDVERRILRSVLSVHREGVTAIAFSPDGGTLVSASHDGTPLLWNVADGKPRGALRGHVGSVYCVAYSADGTLIATGASDRTVRLWNAAGNAVHTFASHTREVSGVAFCPGQPLLASAGADRTVRLWNPQTRQARGNLTGHTAGAVCVAFSRDGAQMASGSHDGTVRLWDVAAGGVVRERAVLTGFANSVYSAAFSADGATVAAAGWDRTVRLFDTAKFAERAVLKGHGGGVLAVAYNTEGRLLATAGDDPDVKVWDAAVRDDRSTLAAHTSRVNAVAVAPDGKTLATGGADTVLKLWDLPETKVRAAVQERSFGVTALAFVDGGATVAAADMDGTVRLHNAADGKIRTTLNAHSGAALALAVSADGKTFASAGSDGVMKVWSTDGRRPAVLPGRGRAARGAALSADGKLAASGGSEGEDDKTVGLVRIYAVEGGKEIASVRTGGREVAAVAFSPDGSLLAATGDDGAVRLLDAVTGRQVVPALQGHVGRVNAVVFSPDGRTLASGGDDGTVKLWDASAGLLRLTIPAGSAAVLSLAFSADGRMLVSGAGDGTVRVWRGGQ